MQAVTSISTGQGARTRLYLGTVRTPVGVEVAHRGPAGLRVRQALPFLRLDSEVIDEEGRFARIGAVSVHVEDGTPSLEMELVYQDPSGRADATLTYGFQVAAPPGAPGGAGDRGDAPIVFETARARDDEPTEVTPILLPERDSSFSDRAAAFLRRLLRRAHELRTLLRVRLRTAL